MPLYLAPYEGKGTRLDPFQPVGASEDPNWSATDLRPDINVADGFAYLTLTKPSSNPALIPLAEDKDGTITPAGKVELVKLGIEVVDGLASDVVGLSLLEPPPNSWKALKQSEERKFYEVILDGEKWLEQKSISGGALPATEAFTGTGALNSTNWEQMELVSSFFVERLSGKGVCGGGSADCYARWKLDAFNADQYSQMLVDAFNDGTPGTNYIIVLVRAAGVGGASRGYLGFTNGQADADRLQKFSSGGSFTNLKNIAGTTAAGVTLRVEIEGSTLRFLRNGVVIDSVTDTSFIDGSAAQGGYQDSGSSPAWDTWQGDNLAAPSAIKSVGGVALASLKSVMGVAKANIHKISGVSN